MRSEPISDPRSIPAETEQDTDLGRTEHQPGPVARALHDDGDDGTVPDKQISRWKNEGGAWLPSD